MICRVQGHALGGGAGLVACADVVIAAPDAVFAFSEAKLGIVPAVISPFALAKIGPSWARRLFPTGERFGADLALRIGLVHEVAEDLDAAVERVLGELRSAGPRAARAAKRLVLDAPLDGLETARRIAERRTSEEGQEGLRAFLDGAAAGLVGLTLRNMQPWHRARQIAAGPPGRFGSFDAHAEAAAARRRVRLRRLALLRRADAAAAGVRGRA